MRVCAIHQPTFFPWLGYFDKIKRANVFVILDQVHYQKSGNSMASWCNRVKINISGRATWISCPVIREHGIQLIDSVRIDDRRPWRDDMRMILERNYRKASNFHSTFTLIDHLLQYESDNLADFNINAIRVLARNMGCEIEWIKQSMLPKMHETATMRLVSICREVGANAYLCGGGASGYLDQNAFEKAGLGLIFQNFQPVPYGDPKSFIPGLSVIDWLMHEEDITRFQLSISHNKCV